MKTNKLFSLILMLKALMALCTLSLIDQREYPYITLVLLALASFCVLYSYVLYFTNK